MIVHNNFVVLYEISLVKINVLISETVVGTHN
jgi:hypothetical protein